jgi:argininosuccinate lyase
MKEEIRIIIKEVNVLFQTLVSQAGRYKDILIPGYTHTQVAMPSSFALWLGAYAESLVSDLKLFEGIIKLIDQSTLGSAAGYGSSFPIDRDLTKKLLGFGDIMVSSVSAQLARGKMESTVAFGLGSFAATLSRLSTDMILFMSQDMNFISFPEELTTGSSIMPHKKNPDVLELIRAHANILIQMPSLLNGLSSNLLSGYHRDFQLTKEILIPGFGKLRQCLAMSGLMLSNMLPRSGIIEDEKYRYLFSVEQVNKKVMEGKSFRDAYMEVAEEIKQGNYKHGSYCEYTHIGSIGNPGLDRIKVKMETALKTVNIKPIDEIFEDLKRL